MGEIKDMLEKFANELPPVAKPNRAVKTREIEEAMPEIRQLLAMGYSLYRISQLLHETGISVSYSLLKATVGKLLQVSPIDETVNFEEPVNFDEPPVNFDEPPVIFDEPPVIFDEPPVNFDEPPVKFDEVVEFPET